MQGNPSTSGTLPTTGTPLSLGTFLSLGPISAMAASTLPRGPSQARRSLPDPFGTALTELLPGSPRTHPFSSGLSRVGGSHRHRQTEHGAARRRDAPSCRRSWRGTPGTAGTHGAPAVPGAPGAPGTPVLLVSPGLRCSRGSRCSWCAPGAPDAPGTPVLPGLRCSWRSRCPG